MTALWLLVVAVAAVAGVARSARRGGPARRAARTHHRVLDTLDTITRQAGEHPVRAREGDDAHTHVRLVRTDGERTGPAPARGVPVRPGRTLGAAPFRAPVARHVIDDDTSIVEVPGGAGDVRTVTSGMLDTAEAAHPAEAPHTAGGSEAAGTRQLAAPAPPPAGDRPSPSPAGHRRANPPARDLTADAPVVFPPAAPTVAALATSGRRRLAAAVAVAALLVVAAAAAVVLTGGGGTPDHSAHVRAAPPITEPAHSAVAGAPARAAPATLISSTPSVALYSLRGPATITLTASSGVSWVELRRGDQSGAIVYQGSLRPGQAQTITGPAWVRLGNPTAVVIAVNETPITAPALTAGEPYDLQFG